MLLQSLLTNSLHFRQLVFLLHGKTVLLSQTRNPGMKLLALIFMAITSIVWPSSKERGTIVLLVELMRKLLVFEAPLSFLKTLNLATCQKSSFPENLQVNGSNLGTEGRMSPGKVLQC